MLHGQKVKGQSIFGLKSHGQNNTSMDLKYLDKMLLD